MSGASSLPSGPDHIVRPGDAPTPFTAAEIRAGCPAGRLVRIRVDRAGGAPFIRVNRYVEVDAEGAVVEAQRFDLDGHPLDEPSRTRSTWRQLQAHASFPAAQTAIDAETIDTAVGRLDCWRYTVTEDSGVATYWFPQSRPGMPVRIVAEEEGVVTYAMTMTEDVSG